MEYITHRRYNKLAMCQKTMNIPKGTKFKVISKRIIATDDNKAICYNTSEDAHQYFAINDDGRGLERGALTWAIAYEPRDNEDHNGFRWSDKEAEYIFTNWDKFVRKNIPVLLFNFDFFHADVEELKQMADGLNIKVKEEE